MAETLRRDITISKIGYEPIQVAPEALLLTPESFGNVRGRAALAAAGWQLIAPDGWHVTEERAHQWRVRPQRASLDRPARFQLIGGQGASVATLDVELGLDLRSAFDPGQHIFPRANRASVLGERRPHADLFARTYVPMPAVLERTLFEGLYSDIVFLRSGEGRHGGLCSGMARWAIARAQGVEPPPASEEAALERITLFHGRQLLDRALLSALPWFLRGSPRAAFRAVRHDLLYRGMTDRALDIKVPKVWRRDLLTALVDSGHTVVPYRLRQDGPRYGEIEVYDPNDPTAAGSANPRVVRFLLDEDRYEYTGKVSMQDDKVGIIAVRQTAYADRGTAYLAFLGSLLFAPRRGVSSLTGREGRSARRIGERPRPAS